MYVIRGKIKIKRGRMGDAIAFLKRIGVDRPWKTRRIYVNFFGDNDILSTELEFDTIEAAAKFIDWVESAPTQETVTEGGWYDFTAGNVVELWKIID